eukprot:15143441-Alexandrium_andersonii.AAC.1
MCLRPVALATLPAFRVGPGPPVPAATFPPALPFAAALAGAATAGGLARPSAGRLRARLPFGRPVARRLPRPA